MQQCSADERKKASEQSYLELEPLFLELKPSLGPSNWASGHQTIGIKHIQTYEFSIYEFGTYGSMNIEFITRICDSKL